MLAMAKFYKEAGFPSGVVQFVNGAAATGALLASHKGIAKVSITGSIFAGIKVQEQATRSNLKKVVLELGGKSPAIVFRDADLDLALGCCAHGFLANSGQICAASSRLYVQAEIAPKFIESMKAEFEKAGSSLGSDPLDMSTGLGPLADHSQLDRVLSFVRSGMETATLLTGGKRKGNRGCFMEPTIFLNPEQDSAIYKQEIFGPVLVIKTFETEEEVINLANETDYGLSGKQFNYIDEYARQELTHFTASLYTTNLDRALRVSSSIESGALSINGPFIPSYNTPFGGFKQSGSGKELGKYGLMEYLKTKTIHIKYVQLLIAQL